MLATLCQGGALLDGEPVSDDARKVLHDVLLRMYEKAHRSREEKADRGVRAAAERGAYAGRKRKPIDELLLREAVELARGARHHAEEAAAKLGVSVDVFPQAERTPSAKLAGRPRVCSIVSAVAHDDLARFVERVDQRLRRSSFSFVDAVDNEMRVFVREGDAPRFGSRLRGI